MDNALLDKLLKTAEVQNRLPESVKVAHTRGQLHLLVAQRMRDEGEKVAGELEMADVIRTLGKKIYTKNAEWRMVRLGLAAMENLR